MYPSIAKACEASAAPFVAFSLPFAVFPAALAPGMPGTPAPGQGKSRESGTQQSGLGYYGPIKHVDVRASQLLDPRVVSRRMIC